MELDFSVPKAPDGRWLRFRPDGKNITEENEDNEGRREKGKRHCSSANVSSSTSPPSPSNPLQKLVTSGVLQIEDQSQAVKKIRDTTFGQYAKDQLEAVALAVG